MAPGYAQRLPEPRNPSPTVDIVVADSEGRVLLIERANEPFGWALPGGFIDYGETAAAAARRELLEETSLTAELTELFHVYSDPKRDPRQHTMSTVFLATATGELCAGDDAASARFDDLGSLPTLVFDHAIILSDYQAYLATGQRPPVER